MRIFKIIMATLIAAIVFYFISTYKFDLPIVTKEALEFSQAETKEALEALGRIQENYARQNRELSSILSELTELSCQTTSLQISLESGRKQQTQAEQIGSNLSALKNRIDKLESEAARARKLDKNMSISSRTIQSLRATIANQEKEITTLLAAIAEKDATITNQSNVIAIQKDSITIQYQTIKKQKEELKRTVLAQTEMLFLAGQEFEQIGDRGESALNVSGRKDKDMVREYKKIIYSKAEQFYQHAAGQGHASAAARAEVVNYKIGEL